jgi:hypothetical protein
VGAAIAAGNHAEKGTCALLVEAEITKIHININKYLLDTILNVIKE